jgi:Glycosyltransferase family 87
VAMVWLDAVYPPLPVMVPTTDMYEVHVDFDTFWHSAVALTQGGDIYVTPAKLTNLNPPLLTVLLVPFAWLDALTAYRVWVGLCLVMVLGSLLLVARELRLRALPTALAMAAVLASSPLHGTLVLGQIYPLLLVGLVGGWLAERRGHAVLGAVLFGITVALKPSLAPVLLLYAAQRRWAPLRAGVASAVVASLVGVAVCGPSSGPAWLAIAFSSPVPDTVDNASLPGLAVRLGLPPSLGLAAGLIVLVGTLVVLARHRDRVDPAGTAVWAVLAAGLLLSPIAWHNYSMLLWPGVLVVLALGRGAVATVLLAVAVIPVAWNAAVVPAVATGRSLYFVILVGYWAVLLRCAVSPGPSSEADGEPAAVPVASKPALPAEAPSAASASSSRRRPCGGVGRSSGRTGSAALAQEPIRVVGSSGSAERAIRTVDSSPTSGSVIRVVASARPAEGADSAAIAAADAVPGSGSGSGSSPRLRLGRDDGAGHGACPVAAGADACAGDAGASRSAGGSATASTGADAGESPSADAKGAREVAPPAAVSGGRVSGVEVSGVVVAVPSPAFGSASGASGVLSAASGASVGSVAAGVSGVCGGVVSVPSAAAGSSTAGSAGPSTAASGANGGAGSSSAVGASAAEAVPSAVVATSSPGLAAS